MLWRYERMALAMGYQVVAGVDEVGMGPLAGPVVGGAAVLPIGARIPGLDDSKLLTPEERERLDAIIRRKAAAVSVCAVDHAQVDHLGLTRARHLATAGAVAGLSVQAEYLLVDAWDVPEAPLPQLAVIRGDRTCASIMAASIVAKVARDRTMIEYDRMYPGYGFAGHKGYATPTHRAAIRRLGPSPIHRTSWATFREFAEEADLGVRPARISSAPGADSSVRGTGTSSSRIAMRSS
jgi:ribonuclease HII